MTTKRNTALIITATVIGLLLVGVIVYLFTRLSSKETEMNEMVEMINYEKEQLEDEYSDMALEIEGYSMQISNDSILDLLDKEQKRVQLLLEELRTVKATNARRISELKAELSSVRKVLVYYVAQVDSLNTVNTQLKAENKEVHQRFQAATEEVKTLSEEREQLAEKVSIASQHEARDIEVTVYKRNGKYKTRYVKSAAIIKVSYTIVKNITTEIGNKTIYLRITTPDGNVLQKSAADLFAFEDSDIAFSSRKTFEYSGEEMTDDIYYTIEETLIAGEYRADLFIDGHLIGSSLFELK